MGSTKDVYNNEGNALGPRSWEIRLSTLWAVWLEFVQILKLVKGKRGGVVQGLYCRGRIIRNRRGQNTK